MDSNNTNKFYVTSPSLASREDFSSLLESSWNSGILTHNGPLVQNLENEIENVLGLPRYISVVNGTLALQLAIRALKLKGTIIVPAFTWAATVTAILWENCKIKFCDVDPLTFNISPESLEENIDEDTVAVMPVHVFGNPCDTNSINKICKKYNLKIIYDAAHAFGSKIDNKSVLLEGDISCVSTHATKIFNTGEGGGLISKDFRKQIDFEQLRFFGFSKEKEIINEGTNAKMTEIHAALGLANLKNFSKTLKRRTEINDLYRSYIDNSKVTFQKLSCGSNKAYFPILLKDEKTLLSLLEKLNGFCIYPRRYFYPSLNTVPFFGKNKSMPISEDISSRIICLPSYTNLTNQNIKYISEKINDALKALENSE